MSKPPIPIYLSHSALFPTKNLTVTKLTKPMLLDAKQDRLIVDEDMWMALQPSVSNSEIFLVIAYSEFLVANLNKTP